MWYTGYCKGGVFMKWFETWKDSLKEFSVLKNLALCGVLCALAIVLGFMTSISIGQYIRIGFSGIPNQMVDYLFGPAVGCIFSAVLDILKYLVKPTGPFFPGFTVSAAAGGLIYGYSFYRHEVSLLRVFITELLVKTVVNVGLNTIWLNLLYSKAILAILPGRILSNVIMLPIDTAIVYFVLKLTKRVLLAQLRE